MPIHVYLLSTLLCARTHLLEMRRFSPAGTPLTSVRTHLPRPATLVPTRPETAEEPSLRATMPEGIEVCPRVLQKPPFSGRMPALSRSAR